MVVRIIFVEEGIIPFLEVAIEHQVQFQMQMRAFAINSRSGVTHYRNLLPAMDRIAHVAVDLTEVPVQTKIRRTVPVVLNHDVLAVVRMTRD